MLWRASPRILSEHLVPLAEPLAVLLRPGEHRAPPDVAALAARALLDRGPVAELAPPTPSWLAPHQIPAARRLARIITRYGGALLADAVGLGKSYVALAVALAQSRPLVLVVPAVLVPQWQALLERFTMKARVLTHEALSLPSFHSSSPPSHFVVVDEAHRFRNPDTNRYRALAKLVVGSRVLLVTATPVHNRIADLFHLFRLFLRDHALAAFGLPSLRLAGRGNGGLGRGEPGDDALAAVAARLTVARSRHRATRGYAVSPTPGPAALVYPARAPGEIIRIGAAPEPMLERCVGLLQRLSSGGPAAPLLRLMLLRRLASSLPALRASLDRHEAFLDLARRASAEGRVLVPIDFQQLFPRAESGDLQLALFPLLLEAGTTPVTDADLTEVARLRALAACADDPKADALRRLLEARAGKTIVFTDSRATVRHLIRRLASGSRLRVAAVLGEAGMFGTDHATRREVLQAFAPLAQGHSPPRAVLATDVLVATDLVSEGLNLQDAVRVVHYDLPWSPARLAQRVGRIDRLGTRHDRIESIAFLPPACLAAALAMEQRLAAKAGRATTVGAAQVETILGPDPAVAALDWCDRLEALAAAGSDVLPGAVAAVAAPDDVAAAVLVVRIGERVEALVVHGDRVSADPVLATRYLEAAVEASPRAVDRAAIGRAIARAAPVIAARVAALQDTRWRAIDRDRLSRRLIPWVLTAARRAARQREAGRLAQLDGLVSRLALGMTAGEEFLLEDLLARRAPVKVGDLLVWHGRLPTPDVRDAAPQVELVAALLIESQSPTRSPGGL
ncbi:MAG: helicase-related protein [Gemmatimonadales bacterium]